jgi:hypothetical protein
MNDQTLMIATILWLRKPPRLQAIVTHFTRAVCAKRDLILLVVLGLDLLLLLHGGLFACTRLEEWRRGVRVLVCQSLPHLRHL